jgi:glutaminyl-peptide cyclotransferase
MHVLYPLTNMWTLYGPFLLARKNAGGETVTWLSDVKRHRQKQFNVQLGGTVTMGSSRTTAKRRPTKQPQSKGKKLQDTAREIHENPRATTTSSAQQQQQRGRSHGRVRTSMESIGAVALGCVVMVLVALLAALGIGNGNATVQSPAPTAAPAAVAPKQFTIMGTYELLKTIPHDPSAFTQGLVTIQDKEGNLRLYEGTGMYGDSDLRILDLNGTVLERHMLPRNYFGEGIVHFPLQGGTTNGTNNDDFSSYGLLQLTWRESTMFEYRLPLANIALSPPIANTSFTSTNNEGWGITYDPTEQVFYMTDGSAFVHVWDRATRREMRKFAVTYQFPRNSDPVRLVYLNELEWDPATHTILANVLGQDVIVRIDPNTGFATTIYDFGSIFPSAERPPGTDVFNGIALSYDLHRTNTAVGNQKNTTDQQHYWVTGKYWPSMYYVKLIDSTN